MSHGPLVMFSAIEWRDFFTIYWRSDLELRVLRPHLGKPFGSSAGRSTGPRCFHPIWLRDFIFIGSAHTPTHRRHDTPRRGRHLSRVRASLSNGLIVLSDAAISSSIIAYHPSTHTIFIRLHFQPFGSINAVQFLRR